MPFGQVPVLEVDGKVLSQSNAIARYIASEHGLTGNDAWDAAVCDQWIDALMDVLHHLVVWKYTGKTQQVKDEARKTLYETALPGFLGRVTAALESNPDGFLVCGKVRFTDAVVVVSVHLYSRLTRRVSPFAVASESMSDKL